MSEPAVSTDHQRTGWAARAGQVLLYAAFAAAIGVFSQWPPYHPIAAGEALIKLSFVHHGKPVGDCRPATPEELAKLPPNMRAREVCPRERSPVRVTLAVNGRTLLDRETPPKGLKRDGAAAMYERLVVPAGEQRIAVLFSDDARARDRAERREATVTLAPGQVLVIDYDAARGGITLQ